MTFHRDLYEKLLAENGEHTEEGDTCWCEPEIQYFDNGVRLIIHRGPPDEVEPEVNQFEGL